MQRRRNVRKIMQEPNAVINKTNIQRRNQSSKIVRTTNNQAIATNISKNMQLRNSAEPSPSKVKYSTVPKLFPQETIYIIGGGPSLKNFNFKTLIGKKTIAINKAIIYHPTADILYWTDGRFYTWFKNEVDNFKGLKFALKPGSQYTHDIKILRKGKAHGIEEDPEILAHGFNSGYAAINLAYHLGAERIILLGFDMANDGKDTHFHDGYPTKSTGDQIYRDKFLPGFTQLKSELDPEGVTVLNASVYSQLTTFTKITIEQALSFR